MRFDQIKGLFFLLLMLLSLSSMLSACGKMGALYLPDNDTDLQAKTQHPQTTQQKKQSKE